ncbi:uncharacterized protein EI90DRAFT_3032462 [Cantharellus anzutake]|uniref:uncharacterized protein n=1 Tax=Cantharellus anzutake TaxID=1750568 RepID=UPI001904A02A|nr:uncharacterized protein EI90DRAFT_3032462 [Cantharellus anzutake]KAF8342208.1 hypothetical protein EI90DRAFT_3032462 [Cantharellus anzutake]
MVSFLCFPLGVPGTSFRFLLLRTSGVFFCFAKDGGADLLREWEGSMCPGSTGTICENVLGRLAAKRLLMGTSSEQPSTEIEDLEGVSSNETSSSRK